MKSIIIALLLIANLSAQSQNDQGTIVYNRQIDFVKMMADMPFLSEEEKDRIKLTWGKDTWDSNYNLTFDPNGAVYTLSLIHISEPTRPY